MAENIVELGFDIERFNREQKAIIAGFVEVYEQGKKLGTLSIPIGSNGGWSELTKQTKELQVAQKSVQLQNAELKKSILEVALAEKQAAAERKAAAASSKQASLDAVNAQRLKNTALAEERKLQEQNAEATAERNKAEEQYFAQIGGTTKAKKDQANQAKLTSLEENKQAELRKQLEKQAQQELKNTVREENAEKGSIEQRRAALIRLSAQYDNLSASERQTPQGQRLGNVVGGLQAQVKGLETGTGRTGRNVGNYPEIDAAKTESAFSRIGAGASKAFGYVRQLAYIIPGVGIAGLLGFVTEPIVKYIASLFNAVDAEYELKKATLDLAEAQQRLIDIEKELFKAYNDPVNAEDRLQKQIDLSNALGKSKKDILDSELKIAKLRSDDANAKYFETGGFGKLAELQKKSLDDEIAFSTQQRSVLDYSEKRNASPNYGTKDELDEMQKYADLLKKQADRSAAAVNDQKKVISDNFQLDAKYQEKLNEIKRYNDQQELIRKTEFAKIEANTIIAEQERILNNEKKFENERSAAIKKEAEERKVIVRADRDKIINDPTNKNADGTYTTEGRVAIEQAAADIVKIDRDTQIALAANHKKFTDRRLAAELEIDKAQLEYASKYNEEIANTETASFDERIDAYAKYYQDEQKLIDKDYEFQKATKVLTNEELLALDVEYIKKSKELQRKSKKDISDIFVSSENEALSIDNSIEEKKLSQEELNLYKSLKNKKQFADKAKDLETESQKKILNEAIARDQEIIDSTSTTEDAKKKSQQRILDNQTKLNKLELTDEQKKEADKQSIKDIYYNLELEGVSTFFSLAEKLSDNYHAKRIAQLEKEKDLLDTNYTTEIEGIKNSTVSQQEKEYDLLQAETLHAAKKQELDNKERQERIKAAKTAKAIAIAQIIIETALAVIRQFNGLPGQTARAIAAGAVGALHLATAIATPIPSFGEGTDSKPTDGPAWVGEKKQGASYQPELVEPTGGSPFITSGPMLMNNLPKGSRVTPITDGMLHEGMNASIMQYYAQSIQVSNDRTSDSVDKLTKETKKGNRALLTALANQKQSITNVHINLAFKQHINDAVRN